MYSPRLLEHFEHPRNAGVVPEAQASVQLENPGCGDVLKLTATFTDGIISEIRFKAQGWVPAIACGSAVTGLARGKTLAEASALTREDIVREVGGVPAASSHAAQLANDALGVLLASVRKS